MELLQQFNIDVQVVDAVSLEDAENLDWKGHDWSVSVEISSDNSYRGKL